MSGDHETPFQRSLTLEIRLNVGFGEREGDRMVEVTHTWADDGIPWGELERVFRDALHAAGYRIPEDG